jgi:preprotein translocase subunit YajC
MMKTLAAAILSLNVLVGAMLAANAAGTSSQAGLSGTITAVGAGSISFKINSGQTIPVAFNDATVVKVNGQVAKATDLQAGMKAVVFGQHISRGQAINEIRAYAATPPAPTPPAQQGGFSGTITATGADSVMIQPAKGQPLAVKFNDATVVKVNGQVGKAADLQAGMKIIVFGQHISLGTPVTEIRAYAATP